jgi:hypothetical protein
VPNLARAANLLIGKKKGFQPGIAVMLVAAAFFLFCFVFLSLWKAVEMWKTLSDRSAVLELEDISGILERQFYESVRRRLATNKTSNLSKIRIGF